MYGNLVPLQKEVLKDNIDIDECLEGLDNCLAHEVCTSSTRSSNMARRCHRKLKLNTLKSIV
jgi:hypothetical protein